MTTSTMTRMKLAFAEYSAYFSRTCPDQTPMAWEHWEAANAKDFADTDELDDPNYVGGRDNY